MTILNDAPGVFLVVDVVAALATAYVAAMFFRSWRVVGGDFLVTAALGFGLLSVSSLFVAASERSLLAGGVFEVVRYAGRVGGFGVLALSYLASRRRTGRLLTFLAAGLALLAALTMAVAYIVAPPAFAFPRGRDADVFAFAVTAVLAGTVAVLASAAFVRRPDRAHLPVPAAFLFMALGQYTWLLNQYGESDIGIVLAYAWRLLALGLLIVATRPGAGWGGGAVGQA